jgi:hypothetical protein
MSATEISKTLSANDTGLTGGHQAGILIPKDQRILGFFPPLDATIKNPRSLLAFVDDEGTQWEFCFIYYNNRFFGGTRDEYRLTRMTKYLRGNNLSPEDEVLLNRPRSDSYRVSYRRRSQQHAGTQPVLKLGSGWKVIKL